MTSEEKDITMQKTGKGTILPQIFKCTDTLHDTELQNSRISMYDVVIYFKTLK